MQHLQIERYRIFGTSEMRIKLIPVISKTGKNNNFCSALN